MTLELTTTNTIKVEVEFPVYRKYGCAYMKATDERNYMTVETYGFNFGISCYKGTGILPHYFNEKSEPSNESEFEAALQDVSEKIKTQIEQSFVTA